MPGGRGLCLLKLVPRILIQTGCSSTGYMFELSLIEKKSEERWGGLQFPTVIISHCYRCPLPILLPYLWKLEGFTQNIEENEKNLEFNLVYGYKIKFYNLLN